MAGRNNNLKDEQFIPPAIAGEESASGSTPDPESDDDVGEMYKEVVGHGPKPGETLADEVKETEKARRGGAVHEEEKEK